MYLLTMILTDIISIKEYRCNFDAHSIFRKKNDFSEENKY